MAGTALRLFSPRALAVASLLLLGSLAPAQAEGPMFEVDPFWPQPLPNNWTLGQVAGLAIDESDHVWVLQRPRSLTEDEAGLDMDPPRATCCTAAPAVIEFDQEGNVVQAWGGPGEGLGYDWPATEHGLLVHGDYVWVGGSGENDGMVLKFTRAGEFVAQYGNVGALTDSNDTTRFGQVADFYFDEEANEIYVADGYGNKRVAVMDAESGEIVRVWGAYGEKPTDAEMDQYNPESPQFGNPVHCVIKSNDDLVYVCDRTNNRVQVFNPDGTFVNQFVFEPETRGPGSAWGLAFSPLDASQEYVIMTDGTNNEIVIWRRADGEIVGRFGRQGRNAGQFQWVHYAKIDSQGNLYSGEVNNGKRMQRWVPVTQ